MRTDAALRESSSPFRPGSTARSAGRSPNRYAESRITTPSASWRSSVMVRAVGDLLEARTDDSAQLAHPFWMCILSPTQPPCLRHGPRGLFGGPCFFAERAMRTTVYVDGFNLYFRALKGTPYKWLDLMSLSKKLLAPHNEITCIKYFTANVSGTAGDPDKAIHQDLYIRACLHAIPCLEVIRGQFATHEVTRKLVVPINGQKYALVWDRKEKGSDVNLAAHLINDAWRDAFDCAVIVSGDSDLGESIRLVREYHQNKVVGLFSANKAGTSKQLITACSFVRAIRASALAGSLFPDTIPDTSITKPNDW
jgi:uncharacterized LabA/DUF88 family protein